MAKWNSVGYIAKSKKNPNKLNLCIERGGTKFYFTLTEKPTDEDVAANPKLAKKQESWPEWKTYDVLEVTDD